MRRTPFGKVQRKLIPVFPHTVAGMVSLISTGYPDPNIFPNEIQEAERNAGVVQYLLNAAAIRLAKEINVSSLEAKRLFAPQGESEEIVYDYTMYLNEAELVRLFDSMPQAFQREEKIKQAVTLTMRHRVAKVAVVVNVNPLTVDTWFEIKAGDSISINNGNIANTYIESYNSQTDELVLSPLRNLAASPQNGDSLVFLSPNGEYLMGDEQWSEEDSLALKGIRCSDGTSAFDAVYQFFLAEVSGNTRTLEVKAEPEQEQDLGESKNGLQNSLTPPQLAGATFTGE